MKNGTIWQLASGICGLLVLSNVYGQSFEEDQPSYRVPKTLPRVETQPPVQVPEQAPVAETNQPPAVVGEDVPIFDQLKAVIIVKSSREIGATAPSGVHGLIVKDIPLLQGSDFARVIAPYLGKPFTLFTFQNHLAPDIVRYCRSKNRPIVDVVMPEQGGTESDGVLQLWFIEATVGKVVVNNPGVKWFSDRTIRSQVRLRPGNAIDSKKLTEDLDWLNRNPFRQVSAQFAPSSGSNAWGQSDVIVNVDDRIPIRPYVGYENSGTLRTGVGQFLGGANWGNAFGLDQQLNYQYSSDTTFEKSGTDSGSYVIPLPWRNEVAFYGSYVHVNTSPETNFNQHGESYGASMRYTVPLLPMGKYHHELTLGFDYKSSNNNLEFNQNAVTTPVSETFVDVMQFQLGYTATLADAWGQTRFIGEAYVSPGDLTDHNKTSSFSVLRLGTSAEYEYGRLSLERVTRLPADFSWLARVTGQLASGRLLPSEEMGFGGSGIRGYYTRTESGDEGVIVNNELRTPPISLWGLTHRMFGHAASPRPIDQFQVLGFFDYGASTVIDWQSNSDSAGTELYSVGAGVRYTVSTYLSAEFDYGWELKTIPSSPGVEGSPGSQASVSVQISY